jgi:hypothetical protein
MAGIVDVQATRQLISPGILEYPFGDVLFCVIKMIQKHRLACFVVMSGAFLFHQSCIYPTVKNTYTNHYLPSYGVIVA